MPYCPLNVADYVIIVIKLMNNIYFGEKLCIKLYLKTS